MHRPQKSDRLSKFWLFQEIGGRESGLIAWVFMLLSALPYFVASQPQLADYPSHLARYHILLNQGQSPWLSHYYTIDWQWTGNLGADLLILGAAPLIGLERAGWLLGAILPPLTGLGIIAVEWVLRRKIGVGAILAMALIWSPAMGLGFYNFCLSLALALLAFALWVRMEGWRGRSWIFLPIGPLVWLCHLSGWGILGILVFGYEWSRRKNFSVFWASWPLLLPFVFFFLGSGEGTGQHLLNYGRNVWAYKQGIWELALRGYSKDLDVASLWLVLGIIGCALIERKIDGRLGWAAFLLLLLSWVVPRHLGGGDYADYRLIAVGLLVACLAIRIPVSRLVFAMACLLFIVRLGVTTAAWERSGRETDALLATLEHIPVGARVAGAVVVQPSTWVLNPLEHVSSYATVRRDALVNSHFAVPGVHTLQVKGLGASFADPSHRILNVPGTPIDLTHFKPAEYADYLWFVGGEVPSALPKGAEIIVQTPEGFLARLAKPLHER